MFRARSVIVVVAPEESSAAQFERSKAPQTTKLKVCFVKLQRKTGYLWGWRAGLG